MTGQGTINVFFRIGQLKVHVAIDSNKVALNAIYKLNSNSVVFTLYSIPHLSLTRTGLPVKALRNGFGLCGATDMSFQNSKLLENEKKTYLNEYLNYQGRKSNYSEQLMNNQYSKT